MSFGLKVAITGTLIYATFYAIFLALAVSGQLGPDLRAFVNNHEFLLASTVGVAAATTAFVARYKNPLLANLAVGLLGMAILLAAPTALNVSSPISDIAMVYILGLFALAVFWVIRFKRKA